MKGRALKAFRAVLRQVGRVRFGILGFFGFQKGSTRPIGLGPCNEVCSCQGVRSALGGVRELQGFRFSLGLWKLGASFVSCGHFMLSDGTITIADRCLNIIYIHIYIYMYEYHGTS